MTRDRSRTLIQSNRDQNMYPLEYDLMVGKSQLCFLLKGALNNSWLWHRRLAHLNFRYMSDLVTEEMIILFMSFYWSGNIRYDNVVIKGDELTITTSNIVRYKMRVETEDDFGFDQPGSPHSEDDNSESLRDVGDDSNGMIETPVMIFMNDIRDIGDDDIAQLEDNIHIDVWME
ncbi:hypothetical protein LXL04_028961 [Taraxacum kok-saghyz]